MKKTLYIIIAVLGLSSCDSFLDIKPKGVLSPETVEDFDLMLNDVVYAFGTSNLIMKNPYIYHHDARPAVKWGEIIFEGNEVDFLYNDCYKNIYIANFILENIEGAPTENNNATFRKKIERDAIAERALNYFLLVNCYAPHYNISKADKDIATPILTSSSITQDEPNATVKELYDFVLSELQKAEKMYSDGHIYNCVRPSRLGIRGLLSKVHLYMQNIDAALYYSNMVLEEYSELYDYNNLDKVKLIPRHYSEDIQNIWARSPKPGINGASWGYSNYLTPLYDKDNDLRFLYYSGVDLSEDGTVYDWQHHKSFEPNFLVSVQDMLLIRAECYAKKGQVEKAMDDVNTIRIKRFSKENFTDITDPDNPVFDETAFNAVALLSAANQTEASAIIRDERRRELAFTNNNLLDLKRYHVEGISIPTFEREVEGETYTLTPGSTDYYLEIAPYVLATSKNMIPNK